MAPAAVTSEPTRTTSPMPRKRKQSNIYAELQSKGIFCLIAGLLVLFVRLPFLGYAMRPFSWVLILSGVVLLVLAPLIKRSRDQSTVKEGGFRVVRPNQQSNEHLRTKSAGTVRDSTAPSEGRIEPTFATPSPASAWGPQVFRDIEWRRFEAVCEVLFCQAGFTAKTQSHGADGGVDIWLYSANATGPAAIVQCKHWRSKPVGVKELREFYGVMSSHKLARGTYATSSVFTGDAIDFAQKNGINIMDGSRLLAQVAQRTPDQQRDLLGVAYEGEYWRPTCASCGVKMVERGKPEKRFWGCANFPRCRNTIAKSAS